MKATPSPQIEWIDDSLSDWQSFGRNEKVWQNPIFSQWQLTAERHEALAVAKHPDHRQQRRGREKPFLHPSFAVAIGSREGNAFKQDERVAGPLIKKESG
jgi:hypothetical protein